MGFRNVHALAAFCQFQGIRASPKLGNRQQMDVYRTFILSVFLYGCKTWTEAQIGLDMDGGSDGQNRGHSF
eukprot:359240-Chlamydomonas_euryale.AAC.22